MQVNRLYPGADSVQEPLKPIRRVAHQASKELEPDLQRCTFLKVNNGMIAEVPKPRKSIVPKSRKYNYPHVLIRRHRDQVGANSSTDRWYTTQCTERMSNELLVSRSFRDAVAAEEAAPSGLLATLHRQLALAFHPRMVVSDHRGDTRQPYWSWRWSRAVRSPFSRLEATSAREPHHPERIAHQTTSTTIGSRHQATINQPRPVVY